MCLWRAEVFKWKVCLKSLARVGWNCWPWWMNTSENNGAAVSFTSATAMAAGQNSCGRGERQHSTRTGRVNPQTKTNKRLNVRNKARCLGNLTDCIIFSNVLLLLPCLRHTVARPCATTLAAQKMSRFEMSRVVASVWTWWSLGYSFTDEVSQCWPVCLHSCCRMSLLWCLHLFFFPTLSSWNKHFLSRWPVKKKLLSLRIVSGSWHFMLSCHYQH